MAILSVVNGSKSLRKLKKRLVTWSVLCTGSHPHLNRCWIEVSNIACLALQYTPKEEPKPEPAAPAPTTTEGTPAATTEGTPAATIEGTPAATTEGTQAAATTEGAAASGTTEGASGTTEAVGTDTLAEVKVGYDFLN